MRKALAMMCGFGLSSSGLFGADHRAHVRFLADDLLEGRGTGTRGHDLAAKYVAAQFEAMGLDPAGVNGTYFQPIRFRNVSAVPEESFLKLVHRNPSPG